MKDNLSESLKSLRSTSAKLNAATDAAKDVVARVEKFLNDECSLGLPVEVYVGGDPASAPASIEQDDDRPRVFTNDTYLCYCRVGGSFRIAIRQDLSEDVSAATGIANDWTTVSPGDPEAWASAPRDLKLRTVPKLTKLLEQIVAKANETVTSTEQAVETAKKVLAALGDK